MDLKKIMLDCCGGRFDTAMKEVVGDDNFLVEGHRNNTAVNACCVMWAWKGEELEEETINELAEHPLSSRYMILSALVYMVVKEFVRKMFPDKYEDIDWYDFEERVEKIAFYLDDWGPEGQRHYALDYMMAV